MSSHRADVVVIGGGIVGAAAAHYIAGSGHRVVVLERAAANRQGSGATAGNLHVQGLHPRRPGQSVALDNRRFLPLQIAASGLWHSIEDDLGRTLEVRQSGGFMVAETDAQMDDLRQKAAMEREIGLATELLDGDGARAALPLLSKNIQGASWCPSDGFANPLLAAPELLRSAQRHGAIVHAFTAVTGMRATKGGWHVDSNQDSWTTPWVINASGPWVADVTRMAGPRLAVQIGSAQMHVTTRLPSVMPYLVQHIGEGLSVKQVAAGNILIGGGWPGASTDLTTRSQISTESLRGNITQACRVLPFIRDARLLRVWAGPFVTTPDEMPVIGPVPGCPGLLIAGGTYSFTLGLLWGVCLRAMIEHSAPPVELTDLGPERLMLDGRGSPP